MTAHTRYRERTIGAAAVPEPALRPAARPAPGLNVLRNSRVYADARGLVVRDRSGAERTYPIGETGIRRAVFTDAPEPPVGGAMTTASAPGSWGRLEFRTEQGHCLLRLELADCLPESAAYAGSPPSGERLLALTGAAGLLAASRLPLTTVRQPDPAPSAPGADRAPGRMLPRWNTLGRGVAVAVWFVAFAVAILPVDHPPVAARVVAAGAALLLPLLTLAARALAADRERAATGQAATGPGAVRIAPVPAAGAGMTVRWVRAAAVRVQERDLVLVDQRGQERWLPRRGPHRVATLVRVAPPGSREPSGVEILDAQGELRGALPWASWFGGPGGAARFGELADAAGLPVGERSEEGWPQHPVALHDTLVPVLSGRTVRRATRFPDSRSGGAGTWTAAGAAAAALVLNALTDAHPTARALGAALAAGALAGTLVPLAAHHLHGLLRLDRRETPA
ncbi:hypothetical protein OG552_11415 [Streptomyces sp. NBC_01476]|uniref:hypothetical protein n=1 Tax=Streptomyces sp. NBC_01476 TaxID=2903881 RepID=UPI002E358ADE|nr:hypothetical protein [Streptomyces sp. NBC_01476]